ERLALWLHFRDARGDATDGRALNYGAVLALFYCDRGRWDEAANVLGYGDEVDQSPPAYGKVYVYRRLAARARVAAHRGEFSAALALAKAAVEVVGRRDWTGDQALVWLALAEVQGAAGNSAEADAALTRAVELYERKGNIAAVARLRAAGQGAVAS